jgi:AcrR family transcriptional regulator
MAARAEAAAATGERLLKSAWRHFSTRAYEDVRLREIAADAEVTVQTLHARFGSKDELLVAAYRSWGAEEAELRDAATVGNAPEVVHAVFSHYEAHGDAILRMLAQEDRVPAIGEAMDLGRDYHRGWNDAMFAPLLDGLADKDRERRLVAMIVATDVLVWKLLRRDMRLPREAAEQVVLEMVDPSLTRQT